MQARRARAYHFLLDADQQVLHDLCDTWFNQPVVGAMQIKPVAPVVLLSFVNNSCWQEHCKPPVWEKGECPHAPETCSRVLLLNEFDKIQGAIKCNQCLVTVFVRRVGDHTPFAFTPYRFIDSGILMIRNRELLGLPDVLAHLKTPFVPEGESPEKYFALSNRMKLRRAFDAETGEMRWATKWEDLPAADVRPDPAEVLTIEPADNIAPAEIKTDRWESGSKVWSGIFEFLKDFIREPGRESLINNPLFARSPAFALLNTYLSLKQFRVVHPDRQAPGEVSYQGILEYTLNASHVYGGGRLRSPYQIKFPEVGEKFMDSLKFVDNLGVKADQVVNGGYYVDFDYEIQFRDAVWEAIIS